MTCGSLIVIECSMPDFPTKLKTSVPVDPTDVPPLQGGQAERAVGVGVRVAADPEVAQVEQPGGGRGGAGERHPLGPEVLDDPLASPGEPRPGDLDPVELELVALGPPLRVVEVLPPPGVVGAQRLDVAVGVRADPHVPPRRRDGEGADPLDLLRGKPAAVGVEVGEALARAPAGPALHLRGDPPQPRHARTLPAPDSHNPAGHHGSRRPSPVVAQVTQLPRRSCSCSSRGPRACRARR